MRSVPRSKSFQGRANYAVSSTNHGPNESVMGLCLSVAAMVTTASKVHTHTPTANKTYIVCGSQTI